jgi:uncharacterized protein YciI
MKPVGGTHNPVEASPDAGSEGPSLDELRACARGLPFFLIEMVPNARWADADEPGRNEKLREHLLWQLQREREGTLLLAGQVDREREGGHGLAVIRARNREEAEALAESEPLALAGLRENRVRSWTVNEGSITVTIRLFDDRAELR